MSEQLFRATTPSGESALFAKAVAIGWGRCYVPIGCMNVSYLDSDLTDLRPVPIVEDGQVVLTLAELVSPFNDLVRTLRRAAKTADCYESTRQTLRYLADQIESQSKPSRMEEPAPIYPSVRASSDFPPNVETIFTRGEDGGWRSKNFPGYSYAWSDLIDPQPIRDGL